MDTKYSPIYLHTCEVLRFPMLIPHYYPKEDNAKMSNGNAGLKQNHSNINIKELKLHHFRWKLNEFLS